MSLRNAASSELSSQGLSARGFPPKKTCVDLVCYQHCAKVETFRMPAEQQKLIHQGKILDDKSLVKALSRALDLSSCHELPGHRHQGGRVRGCDVIQGQFFQLARNMRTRSRPTNLTSPTPSPCQVSNGFLRSYLWSNGPTCRPSLRPHPRLRRPPLRLRRRHPQRRRRHPLRPRQAGTGFRWIVMFGADNVGFKGTAKGKQVPTKAPSHACAQRPCPQLPLVHC